MAQGPLTTDFNDNAPPPPMLDAEAYRVLLEKLVGDGSGYGKTEAVAGYLLQDMNFLNEDNGSEQKIKVEPLYVVMDLKEWPNAYGRSLAMQEIAGKWAQRMVGEEHMNAHDFQAPGIWTAKKRAFESDYLRRSGVDEHGRPLHIYEPDPNAFRLGLKIKNPVTIPTPWGAPWPVGVDGAIAVREKDVASLVDALKEIREGRVTAEEALLTKDAEGKISAKFDVYGMMPGFIDANYKSVTLKPETQEMTKAFSTPKPPTMPVLKLKNSSNP